MQTGATATDRCGRFKLDKGRNFTGNSYFPISCRHYSLWHMDMWEKSCLVFVILYLRDLLILECFFGQQHHMQSSSKGTTTAGNTPPGHRHFAMAPVLLPTSVPWGKETCSNLCPGLAGCHWQVRSGHQNFWVAVAPLAYCVSLLSHHFYIPHL